MKKKLLEPGTHILYWPCDADIDQAEGGLQMTCNDPTEPFGGRINHYSPDTATATVTIEDHAGDTYTLEGVPVIDASAKDPKRPFCTLPDAKAPLDIMKYFAWEHLPRHLQATSAAFGELALMLTQTLPDNDQRTQCLDYLLIAKDAAVRARL
jgi:hypothetical protein